MGRRKIFIVHPSDWLTDHLTIGDGLIAHGFLQHLAERGHEIHIAARMAELKKPFPPNVTLHMIPQRVRLRPFDRLEYMFRVRRLFFRLNRQIRFDIAHQMNPVFTGLSLALLGSRVPLVLGTYVPDWPDDPDAVTSRPGLMGWVARGLKRAVCAVQQAQAQALLLTSPAALPRVASQRALSRVRYVQHGLDIERFSPCTPGSRPPADPPKLLFFSNLNVKKGIFVLLESFREVLAKLPNCKLTIAGGGKDLPAIREIVRQNGWSAQVEIVGPVERERGVELYRSHHVYTLPSFGEPYATTILEAMSCGLPVVSTNSNGVPYMVGPDNLLVPIRDSSALAAALLEFLQDPERASAIGKRNRLAMLQNNSWHAVIDSLEAVYASVAKDEDPLGTRVTVPCEQVALQHSGMLSSANSQENQ